jgi:hypothetical protein
MASEEAIKTPLYDLHVATGGQIVTFAGKEKRRYPLRRLFTAGADQGRGDLEGA